MRTWFVLLLAALLLAAHCAVLVRADDAGESDEQAAVEEAAAPVDTEFSVEQREQIVAKQETHEFQAEVSRLMEILIHSLYKDREIFMREVISNAADALDKVRFLALTDKQQLGTGDAAELDIRIKFDKEAKTITITDKGIGMTKEGLIKHLGVVANSGTTEFLEKLASGGDSLSLIGQFGVGFYSVYLVADRVTVASKNNNDTVQYIWESNAEGTFTVSPDPRGNTLTRGTSITLHLKPDAAEFLAEQKLEGLVQKYSQFINFPIYLWTSKEVEREVPDESAVVEDEEEKTDLDGDKDGEDTEAAEKPKEPKTKKVKEQVNEWKRLNTAKAIWTRSASDITTEEYDEFYKTLAKDTESPLTKIHFAAEGEISFKSILYIPSKAESGLYDKYYEKSTALKLYVRRVLISDEFDDFLPRYLNFVRGVVDSEDLPLNVSRETLAQSKVLRVMAKKLTRKVLEMLTRLAAGKDESDEGDDEEEKSDKDADKKPEENEKYLKFWEAFGKSLKLGVIDDRANKAKLSKLLRYQTSKSEGKFISLQTYVDRMAENQKHIYYVTGEDVAAVEASPFLERLKKRDLEVVYMTDPLDEYVTSSLTEYDSTPLQSVQKEGLKLPGEKSETERSKEIKEEYKDFTAWLQKVYGDKVEKVVISNRIADSPCVLVTGQYGWSANMERIMKAQTFSDASKQQFMYSKKTMEINPRHPIIKEMKARAAQETPDPALTDLAHLMYDAALLQSGFSMKSPAEFAGRIHRVMALGLEVDPLAKADEEEVETETEEPAAKDDAPKEDAEVSVEDLKDEL